MKMIRFGMVKLIDMKIIIAQIMSNSEAICSEIRKTIPLINMQNAKTRIIDGGII